MSYTFTAVFEKRGKWYVGYIEELPGANAQGETLEEVKENLKEAIELVLEANRQLIEEELIGKELIKEPFGTIFKVLGCV